MNLVSHYGEHDSYHPDQETINEVYNNFILIHDHATTMLSKILDVSTSNAERNPCRLLSDLIDDIIEFCRHSLNWVVEDDGTINTSLAVLLTSYESKLSEFINDNDIIHWLPKSKFRDDLYASKRQKIYKKLGSYCDLLHPKNVVGAYLRDYPVDNFSSIPFRYQVSADDDFMVDFFDQVIVKIEDSHHGILEEAKRNILKQNLTILRKYFDFATDSRFNVKKASNNKLVISAYVLASRVAWHSFFHKWNTVGFNEDQVLSEVLVGVLRALGSQVDCIRPVTDQLLVDYVNIIIYNLVVLGCQPSYSIDYILNYDVGIQNVARFLTGGYHPPEQENVSDIRLHFQGLLKNVECAFYTCLNHVTNSSPWEKLHLDLFVLMDKINLVQEEIVQTICSCIISERTAQEHPGVDPLGFLIFVLDFLKRHALSKFSSITVQYYTIQENLRISLSFLKSIGNHEFIYIEDNSTTDYASKNIEDLDNKQTKTLIEKSMVLINYLKSDKIDGEELNEMVISAQVSAFKITHSFLLKRYGNTFHWWNVYSEEKYSALSSRVRVAILRGLLLSLDDFSAPLFDEVLMCFGECIQDNLIELVKDKAVVYQLKHQFEILHETFSVLMHLRFSYLPKQSTHVARLSDIKLRIQVLMMNLGSVIFMYYNNNTIEDFEMELSVQSGDLIKELNDIQEETIHIICSSMISDKRAQEYPKSPGFMVTVLEFFKKLMDGKSDLIMGQYDAICENLLISISFLKRMQINSTEDIEGDISKKIDEDLDDKIKSLVEKSMLLINYLKLDGINGEELNEMLISVQVVTFKIACSFWSRKCGNDFHWWKVYSETKDHVVDAHVRLGILRAVVLSLDGSSAPLVDELLVGYAECIQDNLVELVKDKDVNPVKHKLESLHEGLSFLMQLLFTHQPKQSPHNERVIEIKVRFHALVMNLGSVIYLNYNNLQKEGNMVMELSIQLTALIENMSRIQEEAMGIIISACMISDRTAQEYPLDILIFFLEFLKKLVDSKSGLITDQVDNIRKNLLLSLSFLRNIEISSSEDLKGHASTDILDMDDNENQKQISILMEKSMFLINYLNSDPINGGELNELVISAQAVAFKVAHYFLLRRCGNNFHWWEIYSKTKCSVVDSHVRVGILRALVSVDVSSAELLVSYAECIQDNLIEVVKEKAVGDPAVKHKFEGLHEGLSFLMHLLFTYLPKQSVDNKRLFEIKVRVHSLVMDLGSVIYLYYNNLLIEGNMEMELSIRLTDLTEKLSLIQEETVGIIISSCIISGRIGQEYSFGILIFFLEFLKQLVDSKSDLITDHVDTIPKNLLLSISFLKNIDISRSEDIEGHRSTNTEDVDEENNKQIKSLMEKSMFLINYLKSDGINGEELNELLISAQVIAFKIAHYFLLRRCENNFHWWEIYSKTKCTAVNSHVRVGILRALVLMLDGSSDSLVDEQLLGYVECIQDNLIELVKDKDVAVSLKNKFASLHEGLSFLMHLLFTYQPKDSAHKERLSEIKPRVHALVMNVGSVINFYYNDKQAKRNMAMELYIRLTRLIESLNTIQEETMGIIIFICMISDRTTEDYSLGILIFVLEFLKNLVDSKFDSATGQLDAIRKNLLLSISFIRNIEISSAEDSESTSTNIEEQDGKENNKQIKILIEKSMFLINYLKLNRVDNNGEELKELFISAQVVAFKIAHYFLLRRCGNNFHWWKVCSERKDHVVDSHVRVGILRALVLSRDDSTANPVTDELLVGYVECIHDNLIELLTDKAVSSPVKQQFRIIDEGLSFLMHLLRTYPPNPSAYMERLSRIKVHINGLVMNLGSVMYLYYDDLQTIGKMSNELTDRVSDLHATLSSIKDETMGIFPLIVLSGIGKECPETDQLGYFNFLLQNWKMLMEHDHDLTITWKNWLRTIHENLVHLKSFIENVNKNKDVTLMDDDESQILCNRIMDAGYVTEYLLSLFVEGSYPDWCMPLWIAEFTEHIMRICEFVNEKNAYDKEIRGGGSKEHSSQVSSKASTVPIKTDAITVSGHDDYSQALQVLTSTDVVVGFKEEMKLIRKKLSGFQKKLDVISIIGMPGLGKTTLARKVFEDPSLVSNFDVRAWCCVSQSSSKKDLFLIILGYVTEVTDQIRKKSETDLSLMVHQQLMGRRYFIVLDDVWTMDALMGLTRFFPDNNNKSRIMLTSRSKAIGLKASDSSNPIELNLLSEEESWVLLEHKVYGVRKCPLEFRQVGKDIARKCKGLPLSVVVVAGILAKSIQELGFWEQVAEKFSSYLAHDSQSHWMAALELSYKFLPDSLKPLFLYIGAFPEDMEICTKKLMWLWISEGFVHKGKSTSLEIEAESKLNDLIDRSLVMVAKRRSNGSVKACHIHDLLRDMCLAKAKEKNFMRDTHLSAQDDIVDTISYERRLSIFLKKDNTTSSKSLIRMLSINPPLRTLLSFKMKKNLNSVFSSMKLLRVLHSEGTIISSVASDDVISLVHLRYMSFHTVWEKIPPSISNIWALETLIIKGSRGEIDVPNQIWEMVRLRHLHINPRASFKMEHEDSSKLENLVTLSTPVIDPGKVEKLVRKVPNVHKLSCIFIEGINNSYGNNIEFPNLESLEKLVSLKISYHGAVTRPWKFKLPSTLTNLSLSMLRLKWSDISMFKELEHLEVLKLRDNAVFDDTWDIEDDDEFPKLILLKLENLNIERWRACSTNFPCLEKVVLERCKRLEEIPSELGDCETLQKIEVLWCHDSAAQTAKEIQEEQEECGNEFLTVNITLLRK